MSLVEGNVTELSELNFSHRIHDTCLTVSAERRAALWRVPSSALIDDWRDGLQEPFCLDRLSKFNPFKLWKPVCLTQRAVTPLAPFERADHPPQNRVPAQEGTRERFPIACIEFLSGKRPS